MVLSMFSCVHADVASKVKIKFNGKKIVFNSKSEPKSLSQLEQKWGKRTSVEYDEDNDTTDYIWEKGTTILQIGSRNGMEGLGSVYVAVKDTNASVAGVKVGMKKEDVIKKLQDIYGEKNILITTKGQDWDFFGEDGYIITGKPSGPDRIQVLRGLFYEITFDFTDDGLVSSIYWKRY